ncbi:3-oxoacyl-[acyl-carrier protein] reductase [Acidisarcina polymorpha]|uniref:3-oxoacyl-[acyl-carrier protein] reductase n=1 Tax=Acidisarcina polymorpha TaxID=2211140 RepID=A0A2Z5FWJ9_9BACT|nr:SDR family oxidoreductase [Acidisarcina polymorpha]AXC11142.1 3-oxoacyl-[acyl-carrier protein] reductase [Acidisarcina polymorpha]
MDFGLKNRSVIVAASSDGIARAAADKFAAEGARVAMCSRDEGKLQTAAEEIRRRYGAEVFAAPLDVTNEAAVHGFVEEVGRQFGAIDVCVTNAGGPPAKMFLETVTGEWQGAFDLNLMSVVHLARAVIPWMQRQRWGRIVTITSVSVRQPIADLIYSNTVRAGVLGLVKSLSNEFGQDGITVNNVAPGCTATARLNSLIQKRALSLDISEEEYKARLAAEAALKRLGQAEDVADAIVWLASERASFITGQTLLVDGGLYKGL